MTDVPRETEDQLERLAELVRKWSRAINLVAPRDLDDLKTRHIADSLGVADLVPSGGHLVDLGSGGGFPGLVIAVLKRSTPLRLTLIESDGRKAAFLRAAVRELALIRVTVLSERIESVAPQNADLVTARALAPLPRLLGLTYRHLRHGGTALLMKGAQWRSEVDAARKMWDFTLSVIPSETDPSAAILQVADLTPR